MKHYLLALAAIFSFQSVFSQAKPFTYKNEKRRYIVYVPAGYHENKERSYPMVFNFHGGGMTMTEQMFYSKMNDAADKYGFIAVYPQGIRQDWNVGFEMSYQKGTDDIGYIDALTDVIFKDYRVDRSRVYAAGLSRGGFFCQRVAAELPEKFAAVASVGATLPDSVAYFHKKKIRVGMMIVHGTADEIVRYGGKAAAYKSAIDTYGYWKRVNHLEKATEVTTAVDLLPFDSTAVQSRASAGNGVAVRLVTVIDGGHTLPGCDPFNIGFPLGKTSGEIDINHELWQFFSRHRLQAPETGKK